MGPIPALATSDLLVASDKDIIVKNIQDLSDGLLLLGIFSIFLGNITCYGESVVCQCPKTSVDILIFFNNSLS